MPARRRAPRRTRAWALISIGVSIILQIIIGSGTATTDASGAVTSAPGAGLVIGGILALVWGLATLIPSLGPDRAAPPRRQFQCVADACGAGADPGRNRAAGYGDPPVQPGGAAVRPARHLRATAEGTGSGLAPGPGPSSLMSKLQRRMPLTLPRNHRKLSIVVVIEYQ